MKPYSSLLSALLVVALGIAAVSCEKETPQPPTKAKVTSVKYYPEDKMTAYNYLVNTLGLSPNDITETSSQ